MRLPEKGDGFSAVMSRPSTAPSVESDTRRLAHSRATALNKALDAGDARTVLGLLRGGSAESNAALMEAYASRFGRDLEFDMRGYAIDLKSPLDFRGLSVTVRGLKGADLKEGFRLLHGPRVEANAARIAQLVQADPASTPQGRQELYSLLARAGGEERALLEETFQRLTGKELVNTLRPVFEAAAVSNSEQPLDSPPEKTVAIVVSSGNWQKMLAGEDSQHIGGYHWREIEAYVKEALDRGYTPVIFTPEGLPPSPDAASLLLGKLGPQVGFGLAAGTGPDSMQGRAILEGFAAPRSLKQFDPSQFAAIHVAGGHGSHHDLVGNPLVEDAATRMHAQGKMVTAVCHATPSLGKLLAGGPATGFSPQIDALMMKAGFVLPEFHPPYDAHRGLEKLGVDFNLIDRMQALTNIHHTETYLKNGIPVVTGTGPEATDDVARIAFDWLQDEARKSRAARH
jgi:putative intracellular protease/amidase